MSTETIYQSLYVQSRGALRRELTRCLRTGRALRHPGRQPGQRKNRIPAMVNISERPAEATDRAVPGHWEGDLIIGKRNLTAIGTLVERSSGYTMLVHLPDGYKPEQVAPALAAKIQTLHTPSRTGTSRRQVLQIPAGFAGRSRSRSSKSGATARPTPGTGCRCAAVLDPSLADEGPVCS